MEVLTYAIIENNTVVNVILWDGQSKWLPPSGTTVIEILPHTIAGIGYLYNNGDFIAPTLTVI